MKKSKYKSFKELPVMLTVPDVGDVLGIGRAHAYEVVKTDGFPAIVLGSRIIIPRDRFLAWLEKRIDEGVSWNEKKW